MKDVDYAKIKKCKIEKNGKIGFIFSTFDNAFFLWKDFFRLLKNFWQDFDVYFDDYISMAEKQSIVASEKLTIKPVGLSNEKYTYSQRLIECVNRLNCEYVFIMIDDFFIKSNVDLKRLEETISLIKSNKKIDYIEYENFRKAVKDKDAELKYLKYLKKGMFLCNLQIGVWRAASLKKVVRLNENPWMFEYYGSLRACLYNFRVLTIKKGEKPIFDYDFGWLVTRGKFDKQTYDKYVDELNIDPNMGDKIGYHARESSKKISKIKKMKHLFLATLSFFKK